MGRNVPSGVVFRVLFCSLALLLLATQGRAQAPLSHPTYPVIFIHGIASSADGAWGTPTKRGFRQFLEDNQWTFGGAPEKLTGLEYVVGVDRPGQFYTMNMSDWDSSPRAQNLTFEAQGLELASVIRKVREVNGAEKVILVAHSMGGLAARAYLQSLGANRYAGDVAKLITVGTPHSGSPMATILNAWSGNWASDLSPFPIKSDSVAVAELQPDSAAMTSLNQLSGATALPHDVVYVTLAGVADLATWVRNALGGPSDGLVSSYSATYLPAAATLTAVSSTLSIVLPTGSGYCTETVEVHRCETRDNGVWALLLRHLRDPSARWEQAPPVQLTSGQPYAFNWRLASGVSVSHTNIHWDTIDPKSSARCNATTVPACSTVNAAHGEAPTTYSATITAPTVGVPTTYYYVAHAVVDGVETWSPVTPVLVQPGASASLVVTPSSVDFGEVRIGQTKDLSFTIANAGNATLNGTASVSGGFAVVGGGSYSVAPGGQAQVTVRFMPLTLGDYLANVSFTGGGSAARVVTGSALAVSAFTYGPSSLDFGSVALGNYQDAWLTVSNTGNTSLSVSASVPTPFALISPANFVLGAGQSNRLLLRFTPFGLGAIGASASLVSSAGTLSPPLTGSGISALVIQVPPAVSTSMPFNIRATEALLYGTANPNNLTSTAWFEWGTTPAYGNTTAAQELGSGSTILGVTEPLTGLSASSAYHYRLVAQSAAGTSVGTDRTFTTAAQAAAMLCATPSSIDMIAVAGGLTTVSQSVFVTNCGGGTFAFNATDDQPWLSESPASGSTDAQPQVVTVTADVSGKTPGSYYGNVTITASGVAGSPLQIPVVVLVTQATAGQLTWQTRASMPIAGPVYATASTGTKVFAFGISGSSISYVYDTSNNSWALIADSPGGMGEGGAAVIGSKIYVVTGDWWASATRLRVYDTAANTWATTNIPGALRQGAAVAAVNGKLYVIGGSDITLHAPLADVLEYDPNTLGWTTRNGVMPTARGYGATAVWNNRVYVIGGIQAGDGGFNTSHVESYDPATDAWSIRADSPSARKLAVAGVRSDRIFLFGGLTGCGNCGVDNTFATVDEYDPATNTWVSSSQLSATRRAHAAFGVVADQFYVVAGYNSADFIVNLSSTEQGTMNGQSNPNAPTSLQASTSGPGGIGLSWAYARTDASGFRVERAAAGQAAFQVIANLGASARGYQDAGLAPNVSYTYRVLTMNGGGDSAYSSEATAATPALKPGAPLSVHAGPGNGTATVSFTPPVSDGGQPISTYTVVASPGGASASGAASPVTVSGLSNLASYTFSVTATNTVGTGPASASSAAIVPGIATAVEEMTRNSGFGSGNSNWLTFGQPTQGDMPYNVTGGVFQWYRAGTQAVVFQPTGLAVPGSAPIDASFDIGNSTTVRKRISVLLHDNSFSDLAVCTFTLEAGAPLRTYRMRTHSTQAWTNATISFYAANTGNEGGGWYRLDNVSVRYTPDAASEATTRTECVDPTAPIGGSVSSANLLTNGTFTGPLTPWGTFGNLQSRLSGGVFEFFKLAGLPAGVVLQATGQTMSTDQPITAAFQLGNSSGLRQRVTVLLHDGDFSDITACTVWVPPGQTLSSYAMRIATTKSWGNATLSVYPSTVGTAPTAEWLRLDNVTLARTISAPLGTECFEPGATQPAASDALMAFAKATAPDVGDSAIPSVAPPVSAVAAGGRTGTGPADAEWIADGFVAADGTDSLNGMLSYDASPEFGKQATLQYHERLDLGGDLRAGVAFRSQLLSASDARVQIRIPDGPWEDVATVAYSDAAERITIDFDAYRGATIELRLVIDGRDVERDLGAIWRVTDLEVWLRP